MTTKYAFYTVTPGAISTNELTDDSITADKIADGAIDDAAKLASGVVTTLKIAALAVNTGKIAEAAVTSSKVDKSGSWNFTGDLQSSGVAVATQTYVDSAIDVAKQVSDVKDACLYADILTVGADPGEWVYSGGVLTAVSNGVYTLADELAASPINPSVGTRIFVRHTTDGSPSGVLSHLAAGIYEVTSAGAVGAQAVLTRAADANSDAEVTQGMFVFVQAGDNFGGTGWLLRNTAAPTLGTTALEFSQFSGVGTFQSGNGIDITGNVISVDADSSFDFNGTQLSLAVDGVSSTHIADGAVGAGKLATDAVTTVKISNSAVTADKLATDSVVTAKIADLAVTTGKLAVGAVTAGTIADGAVQTAKIADGAVETAKITNSAVNSDKLASGSVSTAKIVDSAVTADKLASDAVTTAKIIDAAVTTAKIADNAISQAKMQDNSVGSDELIAGSVGNSELAADAVDGTKIADNAVDSEHIVAGAIDAGHLASDSVTTIKILNANVTAAKLASDSVTTAKILDGNVTVSKIANSYTGTNTTTGSSTADFLVGTMPANSVWTVKFASLHKVDADFASINSKAGQFCVAREATGTPVLKGGVEVVHNLGDTISGLSVSVITAAGGNVSVRVTGAAAAMSHKVEGFFVEYLVA